MAETPRHLNPEALLTNPDLQRPFLEKLLSTGKLAHHIFVDLTGDYKNHDHEALAKAVQDYLTKGLLAPLKSKTDADPRVLVRLQIDNILEKPHAIPTIVGRLNNPLTLETYLATANRTSHMSQDATAVVSHLPEYLLPTSLLPKEK